LGSEWVHFTTLESLVGKLGALALAAPGILIKLRRCYAALAGVPRSPSAVLQVAGPLRDELRELLASMPFWRTAVAPCIRPVHLTIIVPGGMVPGSIGRRQYAPSTALVSYNFPGVAPGDFRVSIPTPSSAAHPWPKPQTQMGAPSIFPETAVRPLKTPSFPGEHPLAEAPNPIPLGLSPTTAHTRAPQQVDAQDLYSCATPPCCTASPHPTAAHPWPKPQAQTGALPSFPRQRLDH
jgi:hypothetical protein